MKKNWIFFAQFDKGKQYPRYNTFQKVALSTEFTLNNLDV